MKKKDKTTLKCCLITKSIFGETLMTTEKVVVEFVNKNAKLLQQKQRYARGEGMLCPVPELSHVHTLRYFIVKNWNCTRFHVLPARPGNN